MKKNYEDISETSHDITGDFQVFHDELFKWGMIFKVKTKQKSIQHEYVRSFFFARWDKEVLFVNERSCFSMESATPLSIKTKQTDPGL